MTTMGYMAVARPRRRGSEPLRPTDQAFTARAWFLREEDAQTFARAWVRTLNNQQPDDIVTYDSDVVPAALDGEIVWHRQSADFSEGRFPLGRVVQSQQLK